MDMSGNVAEWVNDWYGGNYYCAGPAADTDGMNIAADSAPFASPWRNPPGPVTGMARVLRGWGGLVMLRTSARILHPIRTVRLTTAAFAAPLAVMCGPKACLRAFWFPDF